MSGHIGALGSSFTERAAPPGELVEHGFGGTGAAVRVLGLAGGIEMRPHSVETDGIPNGDGVQLGEHLTEMLDGAEPSRDSTIRDESDGFGPPFFGVPIDGAFEWSREAMVVLRSDDYEGVRFCQTLGHGTYAWGSRAGENVGQAGLSQVNNINCQVSTLPGLRGEPARYGRSKAALAGAADDDSQVQGIVVHLPPMVELQVHLKSRDLRK
jgi:hypothetical protein